MSTIIEKIQEIFPKDLEVSSRHSYFQLQYFLIGKEPTNQSKMWQCLKELQARKDNLENLDLQIEEEKDNLELQNLNILELQNEEIDSNDIKKRKIEIKIKSIKRLIDSINKNISNLYNKKKNLEEECEFFIKTFQNINKNEPLKHFDDLAAQKEYWGTKLLEKANLRLITGNNIDSDLLETILALPDDIQIKKFILSKINNLTNNLNNNNLINESKKIKNG